MLMTMDAGLDRLGDRRDHRLGVGRRDDDQVVFLRDEVLDRVDLRGEVALVLHADGLEVELVRVLGGVGLSARLHLLEEFVGQRLLHQADLRLVGRERRRQAAGENRDRSGRSGDDEAAARDAVDERCRNRFVRLGHLLLPLRLVIGRLKRLRGRAFDPRLGFLSGARSSRKAILPLFAPSGSIGKAGIVRRPSARDAEASAAAEDLHGLARLCRHGDSERDARQAAVADPQATGRVETAASGFGC